MSQPTAEEMGSSRLQIATLEIGGDQHHMWRRSVFKIANCDL
jgi:hypothetical protein